MALAYDDVGLAPARSTSEVIERANALKANHDFGANSRWRVRAIMDGGPEAIRALLGDKMANIGSHDLPWANLVYSGLSALAQKLGAVPEPRVTPPGITDSASARSRAEKIERVVDAYDEISRLEMQLGQVGRWLPGYGFAVWTCTAKRTPDGYVYPHAQLRDPYDCYPGEWGVDQQPDELAVCYKIPPLEAMRLYPMYADDISSIGTKYPRDAATRGALLSDSGWSNQYGRGLEVVEYYDTEGTHVILPEVGKRVDFYPNPLDRPAFVVAKRFAFNHLIGQYDHGFGLMAAMAKFNILYLTALEDGVFAPTNIYGDYDGQYKIGRKAVNRFPPGTQVDRPSSNIPYQSSEWLNRMERDLRNVIGYALQDDGNSPLSFATGRGLEELQQSADQEVREYQTVIAYALQDLDAKRLEWDEKVSGDVKKPLAGRQGKKVENYTPTKDIAGYYRTKREYGFMSGFDEPQKIVAGGQLIQLGLVDRRTVQEKISGLDDLGLIAERIHDDNMRGALSTAIQQVAAQGDPRALMLAAEALPEGDPMKELAMKYFTPQGEEMSEEEQAQAGQPPEGPPVGPGGGPADITTVLSQLGQSGAIKGGLQTVSRVER